MNSTLPRIATATQIDNRILFIISTTGISILIFDILNSISLLGVVVGAFSILLFLEVCKTALLRKLCSPPKNIYPCLDESKTTSISTSNDGVHVHGHAKWNDGRAPLLLMIHGWSSNSISSFERAQDFTDYHVVTVDLRSHGHGAKDPEFTAVKCASDTAALLDSLPQEKIKHIVIWGHSLGAFIALRLVSKYQGWWNDKVNSMILESPMTNYNLIFDELIPSFLKSFQPLLERTIWKAWYKIHPEQPINGSEDVMVPKWGMPTCRTIVLQPREDSRLGNAHYELLMQHIGDDCESHILDDLTHSGGTVNPTRNNLIKQFLDYSLPS
ncbi:MAG: alpha/beta hydrolase [Candidatus Poseidoniales archaeon]|jgi:pimeloyl-ACP methyl ester carboxylesterase|tara:strand:- start:243 stop:1223 length:981 start_codon:yes stop_codon:yes gene_type:complete